jgi:hypothetical protein
MMRAKVRAFLDLGPLPIENAPVEVVEVAERLIGAIDTPLTDQEAQSLLSCFGLAWCPQVEPGITANPWVRLLWERQQ